MKIYKIIEKKNLWYLLSVALILAGFSAMMGRALQSQPILNFGIDFVGGSTMLLKFDSLEEKYKDGQVKGLSKEEVNVQFIRDVRGILKQFELEKSSIQVAEDYEVIIKTPQLEGSKSIEIREALKQNLGEFHVLEIDFIGPSIGTELRQKSLWIILIVSLSLLFFITWRFEFSFGVAALIALIHDGLFTVSMASLLHLEINTSFVAAILTILGYSINDTIVVFDRVRENLITFKDKSLPAIANISISQTLARSINTSSTTIMVLLCLIMFGGTTIKAFCTVLLLGIVAGTYSSIFIASPALVSVYGNEEEREEAAQ